MEPLHCIPIWPVVFFKEVERAYFHEACVARPDVREERHRNRKGVVVVDLLAAVDSPTEASSSSIRTAGCAARRARNTAFFSISLTTLSGNEDAFSVHLRRYIVAKSSSRSWTTYMFVEEQFRKDHAWNWRCWKNESAAGSSMKRSPPGQLKLDLCTLRFLRPGLQRKLWRTRVHVDIGTVSTTNFTKTWIEIAKHIHAQN